jgi:hypothetical protein
MGLELSRIKADGVLASLAPSILLREQKGFFLRL